MKQVKIDLTGPYVEIVAKLRAIPPTDNFIDRKDPVDSELSSDVAEVLRRLYEAARGRQIATRLGLISRARPVAAFLKDAPFYVETQVDFLLQALARLCAGSCLQGPAFVRAKSGEKATIRERSVRSIFPHPADEPFSRNQIRAKL